jgi:hypothetical protein
MTTLFSECKFTKKPAHPGDKNAKATGLDSPCVPLRWPHITMEALSMLGEARA